MWIMLLLILILAMLVLAAAFAPWLSWWWRWPDRSVGERIEFETIESDRLIIAHATGGSELGSYPNAIECLDDWYAKGVRWFEFDLHWTRDGHLVGLHDWGPTFRRWFDPASLPLHWKLAAPLIRHRGVPSNTFETLRMRGDLTPINPKLLSDWLARHDDAWLVTDIKTHNAAALERLAGAFRPLRARVLAQVFSTQEITVAGELGYGRIGWANYVPKRPINELPALLAEQPVDVVVLNQKTIRDPATWPDLEKLRGMGLDLWLFTVNDPAELAALPDAVNGIITDRLLPKPHRMP